MPSSLQPAALQRKLPLDLCAAPVLVTIEGAREKLRRGYDEDDINILVADGFLVAWNIALKPKSMARELRILPDSIDYYLAHITDPNPVSPYFDPVGTLSSASPSKSVPAWQTTLLKRCDKPFIPSNTLKLILNCGPTHITNLVDARVLAQLPGTTYQRGPKGAALITKESFLSFLKSRLEGGL